MTLIFVALRALVFACGFLGLWTYIALLLRRFDGSLGGSLAGWSYGLGLTVLAFGGAVAGWCIVSFVVRGRGTPAPFDSPRRMVAAGPYRYVRNPMYIGGALLLAGLGLAQGSPSIVLSVPAWWVLFHLLVVFYEEPVLRRKFGRDYEEYCRSTPRWIPRLMRPALAGVAVALLSIAPMVNGAEPKPNFTGEWKLNLSRSDFGPLPRPDLRTERIGHAEPVWRATSRQARGGRESTGQWDCRTDGSRCAPSVSGTDLQLTARITWDGAALIFHCEGTYNATPVRIVDRWTLSPDGKTITISRELSNESGSAHQTIVLDKQAVA